MGNEEMLRAQAEEVRNPTFWAPTVKKQKKKQTGKMVPKDMGTPAIDGMDEIPDTPLVDRIERDLDAQLAQLAQMSGTAQMFNASVKHPNEGNIQEEGRQKNTKHLQNNEVGDEMDTP